MNKAELAARIAERMDLTKRQGEGIVEALTSIITESLEQQQEVTIAGFGTFSSRIRAARMGVNPQNPSERIKVPAVLVPKFKAGKALKDALKAAQKADQGGPDTKGPESMPPSDAARPEEADVTQAERAQDNTPDHMKGSRPFQG